MPRLFVSACLVALATTALPAIAAAQTQAAPKPQAQAPGPPPAPCGTASRTCASVLREVLQRFFDAYVRKDLNGMTAEWHPSGPAVFRRNVIRVEFDMRDVALVSLSVQDVGADAGGARARAVVDLSVTDPKTKSSRPERRVRDFTFLPDEAGNWRIWNEASPGPQFARRLLSTSPEALDALLAAEPELASDDTLNGLNVEAGRLQGLGQTDQVLDALALQARLARMLGNQDVLGTSMVRTGSMRMMQGQRAEAAAAFGEARRAFVATGNTGEIAGCDANLANLAYSMGQFPEAAALYQQAFDAFERLNDDPRMASTLHGLGNALYMQSEFVRALEQYRRADTILERTRDARGQASLQQAVALVNKELGDYPAAAEAWRKCLALNVSLAELPGTARAWAGLGEIARLQGDLGRALESHSKSLEIWDKLADVPNRATANFSIGQLYALQRSLARAIEFYQKALDLDRGYTRDPETSRIGQARDLGGLGGAHFVQGQPEVALKEYLASLALREQLKDTPGIIWTLVHIGVLHASQGRSDEALAAYKRSLELAEPANERAAVCTALALRASVELQRGELETALATATTATEIATAVDHYDAVAYARVVVGKAHQKAGRFDEARAAFEEAAAALRKVPLGPAAETFFDDRRAPFVAMVDLLVSAGKPADAFAWSERGRQRALADMLGGDGAVITRGLTEAERDEERRIARDLKSVEVKLRRERGRQKPDAGRLAALQADAARLESDRVALRNRLFEAHPTLRALRAQSEPAGADAAGTIGINAATAVLSYVVGEDRTWLFAVARGSATGVWAVQQWTPIDVKAADLAQQVRQFREAIATKSGDALKLAEELRVRLLDPAQPTLAGKTRIIVIPDTVLWSLPFEALRTASGRYLVEDAAVSYAPSLSAFGAIGGTGHDPAARRSLVAFADPVPGPAVSARLALLRAGASQAGSAGTDADLPRVSPLFSPANRTTFTGEQARADRLAQGVPDGALLHLGVPVLLAEASPLYSSMVLTPTDPADAGTGLIEVAGLMGVSLPASAAVVPRLEYGPSGGTGEALTALTWSLLVAGTPTTVAGRWVVGDKDPSVVTRFYRNLVAPAAPGARRPAAADSLRKAMLGLIADPAASHPFFWAGLMVIGG